MSFNVVGLYDFVRHNKNYVCDTISDLVPGEIFSISISYSDNSLVLFRTVNTSVYMVNVLRIDSSDRLLLNLVEYNIIVKDILVNIYISYKRGLLLDSLIV